MKKIIISVLLMLNVFAISVSAENFSTYAAPCGNCGSISVVVINEYVWDEYEPNSCIHGYKNGYDMVMAKVLVTYRKCTQCGWKGEKHYSLTGDFKRDCCGY